MQERGSGEPTKSPYEERVSTENRYLTILICPIVWLVVDMFTANDYLFNARMRCGSTHTSITITRLKLFTRECEEFLRRSVVYKHLTSICIQKPSQKREVRFLTIA
jgi:hypothetical protein